MRRIRCSVTAVRRKRLSLLLSAALAAGCLLPCGAAAQSPAEVESRMTLALEAARDALVAEEGRLDELAARNSLRALPGGSPSSAQAAANIRLWNNDIREKETEESRLLERIHDKLARLRPDLYSLARRLSTTDRDDPAPSSNAASFQSPIEVESRMALALEAARDALVAEEGRLDALAARNRGRKLPGEGPSSAQAAANIRLWNNDIREKEAEESRLLDRIREKLDRLRPDLYALARRLSTAPPALPPTSKPTLGNGEPCSGPGNTEQPLQRNSSLLFRRILSLPGAVMHPRPGAAEADKIKTFSVFYVYESCVVEDETWLRVGQSVQRGSEGWVAGSHTEEWRNMLVMQFPDRVNRQRVLFFENEVGLRQILDSFQRELEVAYLYGVVQSGDAAGAIEELVAVEPAEAIAGDARPYLMPILDWRTNVVVADTGDIATLVQVAGLNAGGESEPGGAGEADLSELDIGIAFVIDTTRSMGPYIQAAREVVVKFAREIEHEGLGHFVDFALVGYRDNTSPHPGIEYVSRIYRDFGESGAIAALEEQLGQAQISPASTQDWREDAFAGLRTAIENLSWSSHMDARVIVLITDAGARAGSDPLSSNPRYDALNVLSDAQRKNIAIVPIHLLTPESEKSDNTGRARRQYQDISITPEGSNYIALAMGDERAYRAEMQAMVANLRRLIGRLERDESIEAVREDETLPQNARVMLEAFATDSTSLDENPEGQPKPRLAAIVQNQLFRAQLQYLGRKRETALPPFYRAWAADLDLANPLYQALDVRVFLTRNQLNALAEVLDLLLDEALRSGMSAQSLLERLRLLSASTSVDPNLRFGETGPDDTIGSLLPDFLKELPYTSNIFDLSLRDFANASIQLETVEQLGYKLEQYHRINGDTTGWLDLGSGDPGEFVYPIQLRLLP